MRIESIHFRRWIETGLEWNVVGRGLRHVFDRSPITREETDQAVTWQRREYFSAHNGIRLLDSTENVGALVVSVILATLQDTAKRDTEERTLKTG